MGPIEPPNGISYEKNYNNTKVTKYFTISF